MKIAFFSTQPYDKSSFIKANSEHDLVFFETQLNIDTVNLAQGADAVCSFVNDKVNQQVLEKLSSFGIKCLLLRCAGFNNVDLETARKLDFRVLRVPAYSPYAVAEHALALIQTLNRKTHKAYNRVKEGNFSLEKLEGFDIHGKTIGVIGTGKIGSAFCNIMSGFGCKILAYSRTNLPELEKKGVKYVDLDTLYAKSDIISLHCPLNESTAHIINEDSISKMKPGIMIINTSRGGLIDTTAAIKGLKRQHIGYMGIDVYEQEEHLFFKDLSETIIQDDEIARLTTFPNVLITAHQGFFTHEALGQIAETTLQNASDFVAGNESDNEVKP